MLPTCFKVLLHAVPYRLVLYTPHRARSADRHDPVHQTLRARSVPHAVRAMRAIRSDTLPANLLHGGQGESSADQLYSPAVVTVT